MSKLNILWQNRWFNCAERDNYHFFHQPALTIAVLPIIMESKKVLLRREVLPCYTPRPSDGYRHWTVVTGKEEPQDGGDIFETMLRELAEETGIVPRDYTYNCTDPVHVGKYTDMKCAYFLLHLRTWTTQVKKSDSAFESAAENHWVDTASDDDFASAFEKVDSLGQHLLLYSRYVKVTAK